MQKSEPSFEEMQDELARARETALSVESSAGTRQDRRYDTQKKGNFFAGPGLPGRAAHRVSKIRKVYGGSDRDE